MSGDRVVIELSKAVDDRKDKNKSQNDWRQRKKQKEVLAESSLSVGVQRMLIDDGHVPEDVDKAKTRQKKKIFGQAITDFLEEMLAARPK